MTSKQYQRFQSGESFESDSYYSKPSAAHRTVYLNEPDLNDNFKFPNNSVKTSKYSISTFLPLFLFQQFSLYVNLFFAFIIIIQQIPDLSPTGRWSTLIPLLVVLGITAIKEILEDYKRHQADKEVDKRLIRTFRNGAFQTIAWSKVRVGDIVRVITDELFPADLVLLSSSEPNGACYVETSNIDGETNLKYKQGCALTTHLVTSGDVRFFRGLIDCEEPNHHLNSFKGVFKCKGSGGDLVSAPLRFEQLLLRGCQLRNTQWAYGAVIYTGKDSKLIRNTKHYSSKRSKMGDATNKQILFITLMLFLMALISFIFSETWIKKNWDKHYYLGFGRVNGGNFFLRFLSFIVLYHNMVPISLIVILEFVKYVQATWLIAKDLELYDAETDTPASVRTSSLNGELGQVQYIFTDKTGTLTRNVMVFRKCSIGGEMYGILPGEKVPEGVPTEYLDQEGALRSDIHDFVDPRLLNDLCSTAPNASVIRQFLTNLAVCHTVIPEVHRNDTGTIGYQAQSPDEGALVSGVKSLGFSFNVRTSKDVIINVLGHDEVYEILKVCEFTSARKRMSVIVRTPQNRILLMCKGADNVIFERLGPDQPYLEATANHLEYFASQGLRTLCIAVAELSEDEYAQWSEDFDSACRSLGDREQEVAQTCEKIEKEMFLLGCTAIEDKLQEEIPETLSALLSAGIKVWVLTGDKQETAINIGYASQLFNHQSDLLICNTRTREETHQWLINHINYARQMMRNRQRPNPESCLALVIDGVSLAYSMEGSLQYFFVTLALKCHSVVACRVSPLQKAHVVQLVRGATNAITLAIGDGANDVTMLQTAHVGVGISGKEGLQAARASDYSFAQFRFLKRLLLVHGNLSYRRIAHVVLYTFYKNICLYIIQFWFAMANGFSGQILFDEWMLAFYNVLFTALPPLCMGIFDRTLRASTLMKIPQLYQSGIHSHFFNSYVFWQWCTNAICQSALIYLLTFSIYQNQIIQKNGHVADHWTVATAVYTSVFFTVTLKAALIFNSWTVYTHISIWVSVLVYVAFLFIYCAAFPSFGYTVASGIHGAQYKLFGSALFYYTIILVTCIALTRDFVWKVIQRLFFPSDYHVIQEMERLHRDPALQSFAFSFQRALKKLPLLKTRAWRGYAFSQEEREGKSFGQADIIRAYDTTKEKPTGC